MTTITNVGDWVRGTTVSTNADQIMAYHVRAFVKALDDAGVPDETLIEDRHARDTQHLTGLRARVEARRPSDDPETLR